MIITQTPLRISILGGNTDFSKYFNKYGGAVLSMTIDKYIYCIVKKRFDKQIWINYSEKEIVNDLNDIKHDLVREAMKLVGVTTGVEITFLSDIPSEGSGLGSSSAVVLGLLKALHEYKNESVSKEQLVKEACQIEIEILKKPIGVQDQYAIVYGGLNLFEFNNTKTKVKPVKYTEVGLMLFYTGITRKSETILSKMKLNKRILDRNKKLVYEVLDGKGIGEALDEYWQLKKKLNKSVSSKKIDELYDYAKKVGAVGGKIVGAGGGGFLLLAVPLKYQEAVREMLPLKELPFRLSDFGSRVIFQNE